MRRVILASGSPRRRELLSKITDNFSIDVSDLEEITSKTNVNEIVLELSLLKARDIANKYKDNCIIIGADTMVSLHDKILGKPKDRQDAYQMLRAMSNEKHQVYTGVTIILKDEVGQSKTISFVERSDVFVNELSDSEIEEYLNTGEPFDKAGAYGIQGKFGIYIGRIEGDYNNIVGFPIARVYKELKKEGIYL